ncbi:hypothetical protein [Leptospira alexanderi]|uniref:Lipoprotein n=1 Tax=Leptospira alexanderi serovar Manhao 3 str. L 60 TaxID=1049759 RepID=V6I2U6_9LEPT|nr:hypothetical protein [Leptospira alexanderi]EQA63822.1 putative lipoprotein [Leptospira alexanderi serovar Manhao 3 str. L 60]
MKRIELLFLVHLAVYGCLQFPFVSSKLTENEVKFHSFSQNEICYEFIFESMNGKTLEVMQGDFKKYYINYFQKIKNEIQNYFFENSTIRSCFQGSKAKERIQISLEVNTYPDCSRDLSVTEINGCKIWGYFTAMSFGIIPFWGRSTSDIRFEIIIDERRNGIFQYQPSMYSITHFLLLPFAWINLIRSMPEAPFRQSVELFFLDSGLKKNSLPR